MTFALPKFISSLSAFLLLTGCAGLPVRGTVGGQTIETRVDSEAARYYLASYLAGKHDDAALDERIDRVYGSAQSNLPDRSELKRLSDDFSIDFAALYLLDRIARTPVNRSFRSAYEDALVYTRKTVSEGRVRLRAAAADYEWLFVPTYLYKRYPITGADFAGPQRPYDGRGLPAILSKPTRTAPLRRIRISWSPLFRSHSHSGHRLIVVSASKSGPEVALALTKLGSAGTRHIAAWVDIVGALQGTPLADTRALPEIEINSVK